MSWRKAVKPESVLEIKGNVVRRSGSTEPALFPRDPLQTSSQSICTTCGLTLVRDARLACQVGLYISQGSTPPAALYSNCSPDKAARRDPLSECVVCTLCLGQAETI